MPGKKTIKSAEKPIFIVSQSPILKSMWCIRYAAAKMQKQNYRFHFLSCFIESSNRIVSVLSESKDSQLFWCYGIF